MKKNIAKSFSVILAVIIMISTFTVFASANDYGKINDIVIKDVVTLDIGDTYSVTMPTNAEYFYINYRGDNDYSGEILYNESCNGIGIKAVKPGVQLFEMDGFSRDNQLICDYFVILVVKPEGKTVADMGTVKSVSMPDTTIYYKHEDIYLKPDVEATDGAYYCTCFSQNIYDNENAAYLYSDGEVYGSKKGKSDGACFVIDAQGNIVSDSFSITVKYTFVQWFLKTFLWFWFWTL